jgi:hypothetical protein
MSSRIEIIVILRLMWSSAQIIMPHFVNLYHSYSDLGSGTIPLQEDPLQSKSWTWNKTDHRKLKSIIYWYWNKNNATFFQLQAIYNVVVQEKKAIHKLDQSLPHECRRGTMVMPW